MFCFSLPLNKPRHCTSQAISKALSITIINNSAFHLFIIPTTNGFSQGCPAMSTAWLSKEIGKAQLKDWS
ncbi:hypothetical protein NC653_003088 [Populus alba x Populus x berolinensis]|uniref:Uncharacterized protein n=1 Tax=Populus alba x Populus x berolinensis TaxID=444605 RepID=A0AAD6RQJ6_9ROSI|nr:hypothetical protein NC653_003088 [Populus alba x Populus x berolinensis]